MDMLLSNAVRPLAVYEVGELRTANHVVLPSVLLLDSSAKENILFVNVILASILRTGLGNDNRLSAKFASGFYCKILPKNGPFQLKKSWNN